MSSLADCEKVKLVLQRLIDRYYAKLSAEEEAYEVSIFRDKEERKEIETKRQKLYWKIRTLREAQYQLKMFAESKK